MLPSFYPAITPADDDMKELLNNYAYTFRNKPHQFHNGGLWPVWNGLMAMALSKHQMGYMAQQVTAAIHAANQQANNAFNECFNGLSNQPCGVSFCAWSAAGAIIAEQGLHGNFLITNC
jgi:glycogen debranching enzyme